MFSQDKSTLWCDVDVYDVESLVWRGQSRRVTEVVSQESYQVGGLVVGGGDFGVYFRAVMGCLGVLVAWLLVKDLGCVSDDPQHGC